MDDVYDYTQEKAADFLSFPFGLKRRCFLFWKARIYTVAYEETKDHGLKQAME